VALAYQAGAELFGECGVVVVVLEEVIAASLGYEVSARTYASETVSFAAILGLRCCFCDLNLIGWCLVINAISLAIFIYVPSCWNPLAMEFPWPA
jgi:hypothetical protein